MIAPATPPSTAPLTASGRKICALADVTDRGSCEALITTVREEFGRLKAGDGKKETKK